VLREFYSERDVVREERASPTRATLAQARGAAVRLGLPRPPYRRPVIGWTGTCSSCAAPDAERFFRTWYAPNNTVLAAVGDVDPAAFIALVRAAFGPIPAQPLPPPPPPPSRSSAASAVALAADAQPELLIAWHKPTLPTTEDYVFDLVDGLLTSGRTSRLYRRLVEETQVGVRLQLQRAPGRALRQPLHDRRHAARAPHGRGGRAGIDAEIARLIAEPPAAEELLR